VVALGAEATPGVGTLPAFGAEAIPGVGTLPVGVEVGVAVRPVPAAAPFPGDSVVVPDVPALRGRRFARRVPTIRLANKNTREAANGH
jgi:hypothetical protein